LLRRSPASLFLPFGRAAAPLWTFRRRSLFYIVGDDLREQRGSFVRRGGRADTLLCQQKCLPSILDDLLEMGGASLRIAPVEALGLLRGVGIHIPPEPLLKSTPFRWRVA
jgi:hypothetical protein